jgi:hypothetical protein
VLLYVKPEIENILGALSLKEQTTAIQTEQIKITRRGWVVRIRVEGRWEYENALKHEKVNRWTCLTREDLHESGQTCVATTSPFVLLLLIVLHKSVSVLDGGGSGWGGCQAVVVVNNQKVMLGKKHEAWTTLT